MMYETETSTKQNFDSLLNKETSVREGITLLFHLARWLIMPYSSLESFKSSR